MKILKYLGIALAAIVALAVILAMFSPSELQIERSTTINAPVKAAFDQVICLDKWAAWSAWQAMDPEMKNEYAENPCGTGAWNSWDGPKAGKGKQTISIVEGMEYIKMELEFDGFEGINYSEWKFEETDGVTTVTWNFQGATTPFMFRPMNLMMTGALTESYDKGLAALKAIAEAAPEESKYSVEEIEIPTSNCLLVSGDVKPKDIGKFYEENFGKLMTYCETVGAQMINQPAGLFYAWTDTLAKMAAGINIDRVVKGKNEIEFQVIEGGKGLMIEYFGAYDKTEEAHYAMDDYIKANGLEIRGAVIEVYVTDPSIEPDTSKWQTNIIYPVK